MQGLAAIAAPAPELESDSTPCRRCGTPIAEPQSSDYRGLGRIEHTWRCGACGETFRTAARMAGAIDPAPDAVVIAA